MNNLIEVLIPGDLAYNPTMDVYLWSYKSGYRPVPVYIMPTLSEDQAQRIYQTRFEHRRQHRYSFTCPLCGGPATSKHHIIPRAEIKKMYRGKDLDTKLRDRGNLIKLCIECHREIHRN